MWRCPQENCIPLIVNSLSLSWWNSKSESKISNHVVTSDSPRPNYIHVTCTVSLWLFTCCNSHLSFISCITLLFVMRRLKFSMQYRGNLHRRTHLHRLLSLVKSCVHLPRTKLLFGARYLPFMHNWCTITTRPDVGVNHTRLAGTRCDEHCGRNSSRANNDNNASFDRQPIGHAETSSSSHALSAHVAELAVTFKSC